MKRRHLLKGLLGLPLFSLFREPRAESREWIQCSADANVVPEFTEEEKPPSPFNLKWLGDKYPSLRYIGDKWEYKIEIPNLTKRCRRLFEKGRITYLNGVALSRVDPRHQFAFIEAAKHLCSMDFDNHLWHYFRLQKSEGITAILKAERKGKIVRYTYKTTETKRIFSITVPFGTPDETTKPTQGPVRSTLSQLVEASRKLGEPGYLT